MTTKRQREFLSSLYALKDEHDIASADARLRTGNGREDLSLYPDLPEGTASEHVLPLRRGIPMAEVEPLVHAGYLGMSERPPAMSMYVWITARGRALVERDFAELPNLPPAQIITVLAERVDSVAVS